MGFSKEVTNNRHAERGSFLIWAIGLNVILLILAIGYYPFFQTVLRAPSYTHQRDQAVQLAEAGVAEAMWEFNTGGLDQQVQNWDGGWVDCVDLTPDCKEIDPNSPKQLQAGDGSGITIGEYMVRVEDISTNSPTITATGYVPDKASYMAKETISVVLVDTQFSVQESILGDDAVHLGLNVMVDSYDSALGAYDPVTNKSNGGDIHSNASAPGPPVGFPIQNPNLYLASGVTVDGTVSTASDADILNESTEPVIFDDESHSTGFLQVPPLGANWNWGNKTCGQNTTCSIGGGDYHYECYTIEGNGKLQMAENARIIVHGGPSCPDNGFSLGGTGTVEAQGNNEIIVENNFDMQWGGGLITVTEKPEDLQIFAKGDVNMQTQLTETVFYGIVYAEGDIYFRPTSGADTHGALISHGSIQVNANVPAFHFDESLRNMVLPNLIPKLRIQTWQTLNPDGSGM